MDKKTLFIVLGLIIIGVIFFTQSEKLFNLLQLDKPVLTEEEVEEITYQARRAGDISLCEKLQNQEDKDKCKYLVIYSDAGRKRDLSMCDQVEGDNQRLSCRDNVIALQAFDFGDPDYCENMANKEKIDFCKERAVSR